MGSPDRGGLRNFAAYFLAWTGMGLFFFTQDVARNLAWRVPVSWRSSLVSWLLGVWISTAFTPVILWLGRRLPFERRVWARRTAVHLLLSLAFSITHLALMSFILARLGIYATVMKPTFGVTFFFLMILGFHGNVVAYWTVLGIQSAVHYYNQYQERRQRALQLELQASELRTELVRAQLTALKGQLQPHFLFNTLNAIMVLVRQGKGAQAEEMLARLSDLLRGVLDEVDAQEVPLRRELEYLKLYLAIEEVRFQDRLRVTISTGPETLDALVPHLGLQPLVENAIRHGIGRRSAAGRLEIRAERRGDVLEVRVTDDGPGLPSGDAGNTGDAGSPGIGLANTRARLRQLYGDEARLDLANGAGGGAVATLTLPYRTLPYRAGSGPAEAERADVHALESVDR